MAGHDRMRTAWYMVVILVAACGAPEERMAERALRLGVAGYNGSDFALADSLFTSAPEHERAVRNSANARYRLHDQSGAIAQLRKASAMDTSIVEQAIIRYNLGRVHLAEAMYADSVIRLQREALAGMRTDAPEIAARVSQVVMMDSVQRDVRRLDALIDSSLTQAIHGFKACLRIDPADDSARLNLAIAQRLTAQRLGERGGDGDGGDKDKDQQLSARAELIMQRADSLVEVYRFREALDVLQQGLKQDPSLKAKKEYMDKLDTVTKAAQAS